MKEISMCNLVGAQVVHRSDGMINSILWALPKGTVLRGLGWGGGRGSGGSKKKETTMEEKVPRLLRLSCSGQGSFDVVSISLCII